VEQKGAGRLRLWLIFRAPAVLLGLVCAGFILGAVFFLLANPANMWIDEDVPFGSTAPLHPSNLVGAIVCLLGAAVCAARLVYVEWQQRGDRVRAASVSATGSDRIDIGPEGRSDADG
jgi:hypothetical protein